MVEQGRAGHLGWVLLEVLVVLEEVVRGGGGQRVTWGKPGVTGLLPPRWPQSTPALSIDPQEPFWPPLLLSPPRPPSAPPPPRRPSSSSPSLS